MNLLEQLLKKLPFEPQIGEKYYYPAFDKSTSYDYDGWRGYKVDERIKRVVGVYRTSEEALEKAKELGWV